MTTPRNSFGYGTLNLEVIKCTETEKKDGYILKLQHKSFIENKTPFGLKKQPVQVTFYMKTAEECPVGFTADMNIDQMRITEREFTIEDEESEHNGDEIKLKWLHF